jgi:antitoxin component of MazEF toxin-antitoxin module
MAHGQMKTPATTAASQPAVAVPAAVLASYAGTYLNRGDEIVVTVENGRLMLLTAAGKSELAADTATRFAATAGDARVEFVLDAAGAPTALVLRQGGMMIKAPRK